MNNREGVFRAAVITYFPMTIAVLSLITSMFSSYLSMRSLDFFERSVGVDVSTPGGQEVIYELAKSADVFLTNYKPSQRQKNRFDVEHIRAVNPDIVYARGSAYGDKGVERDSGGYDGTAFWTRSGIGHALTP